MGVRLWIWLAVVVMMWTGRCRGHGRLIDPPSRASAWRFGWDTPIDYNDNEGFCGGFNYQYQVQGGRCGICGDAWDENPRPHEVGGKYATGTIVRQYSEGQVIPVKVDITSNHRGYFEFRICPNNNPAVEASQTCLNQYPLFLADGSGFQHRISPNTGEHLVHLRLPKDLTCTQCVFQWRYVAGNNWGICEDGTGQLGCGPQEEFRACADVAITSQPTWSTSGSTVVTNQTTGSSRGTTGSRPPTTNSAPTTATSSVKPSSIATSNPQTTVSTPRTTTSPATTEAVKTTEAKKTCKAVGAWQTVPGMDKWCVRNCNNIPPFCPASHCICI